MNVSLSKYFSKKQLQILSFPNTSYDALICDGSIRAGKTSIMSIAFIMWAMREFDGQNFAICSKTVGTAEKNILKPLMSVKWVNERYGIVYRRSQSMLEVSVGSKTNYFYVYGGRDNSSYMLIQGITLAGVFLDEVALMPKNFVEQALARCSVDGRRFWFNCNPEGQLHWFNQEWVLQPEKHNALHLHFTLRDNPGLSEKIITDYENMYSGVFYDRYIRGMWVAAEGLIYDMFDPDKHVFDEDHVPETEGEYYISSDFGVLNPQTFHLWRKEKGTDVWVCLDEYYYSGKDRLRQKTVAETVDDLIKMLDGVKPKDAIIDPSANALIVEMRKRGFKTRGANNDVINGISDVQYMLKNNQLKFSSKCKMAIAEFGMYVWDDKAAMHGKDEPIKDNDHCMDDIRYFVKTMRLVTRKPMTETEKGNLMFL